MRPVLRISRSFEGHCALTNANAANEVQQNVVTVKKGKKARHKSNIMSFQVNNPYLKFKILTRAVLLGRLNIFFFGGGGGGEMLS